MEEQFKITNMSFNYGAETAVKIDYTASFPSGNTTAGKVGLTLEEFNSNRDGLLGYSRLVKEKIVEDFEKLEEIKEAAE